MDFKYEVSLEYVNVAYIGKIFSLAVFEINSNKVHNSTFAQHTCSFLNILLSYHKACIFRHFWSHTATCHFGQIPHL